MLTGGLAPDDPRILPGGELHAAFGLLQRLELLHTEESGRHLPVDPAIVAARVVTPMSRQGAELLQESARWTTAFQHLGQLWRRTPGYAHDAIAEVRGIEEINQYIGGLVAEASTELLTAQPQAGREPKHLKAAAKRDGEAIQRGVTMRTLYQHAARHHQSTVEHVNTVTRLGAQVRTLDEFFDRIIIIDRRIAIVPALDRNNAMVVREPSLVSYFVSMFDRSWARGRPFLGDDDPTRPSIADEQREMTIRMLRAGHSDSTSAKRMGVSVRTYAGYVADLKAEHGTETRFQLGFELGRRRSDD
ncbi:LuxR family transcriptional regulator [Nocardioides limicola]|uniref:LuxR family transcriptional regulator n=1 Tax=Nocardioides limicola TaxID=2803368 RepID=UPI00193C520A|nr:LuxR family transcriptional regulator [Nocardioides sp. DJM-14]